MGKKSAPKPNTDPEGVDMARIRELMGPLPEEKGSEELADTPKTPALKAPTTAPVVPKSNEAVAAAAEEANATLKAMAPDLGKAKITKVEDEVAPVSSGVEPEDGAAPAEGEGIVADDASMNLAVDDIVASEGDEVLEAEDKEKEDALNPPKKQKHSFGDWVKNVWAKPAVRWSIVITLLLLLLAAALVPVSRYFVLNTVGVRASLNATVVDSGTRLPLKNVQVSVAGVTAQTDSEGKAKLEHLKLGSATLTISKRAFTTVTQKITIGWGSNPEGQFQLTPSGALYSFVVTDFLSNKPIEKAEASSGEGNAASDKNGKITLSLDTSGKADSDELTIQITATGYRQETVKIMASNKEASSVKMVPARKDVFVSKRSGKYDIYSIDIDGKNEKKIVSGTGLERDDMTLVVGQNSSQAAYVATRENVRNADGYLLQTLYLVDTDSGSLAKLDQSEQIQIIGWSSDSRLVYVKIAAGASGANPKRHRLVSVSTKTPSDTKEIASANAFNDVVMAGDKVLYAPSNALQDNPKPGLFMVNADSTAPVTLTSSEVYNIFRTDYETVLISVADKYYTYKIGAAPSTLTATNVSSDVNRLYIDGFGNNKNIWFDNRDGKGVLLAYNKASKKDASLATHAGLKLPMYWLNDKVAVYRVNDGKETADYAVSVDGGQTKKIQDVSDVPGLSRWYYY